MEELKLFFRASCKMRLFVQNQGTSVFHVANKGPVL